MKCRGTHAGLLLAAGLVVAGGCWLLQRETPVSPGTTITIYGTSKESLMRPVLAAYRADHPEVRVSYLNLSGSQIDQKVRQDIAAGRPGADLIISTAMDLQVRLVNDGYGTPHRSRNSAALPPWARWRDEAFGITFEPIVMIFNSDLMAGRKLPQTRAELHEAIVEDTRFWKGRVGTYDIDKSAIGFLLAAQESRWASDFGALMKAFGMADVELFEGGGDMLNAVESGRLALGYGLLGGNVERRMQRAPQLSVVYPKDFTLAVLWTAVIPRNATDPQSAHSFLDFLLSPAGQVALAERTGFDPIRKDLGIRDRDIYREGIIRPIPLWSGLLVHLDARKRQRLLDNWQGLVAEETQ